MIEVPAERDSLDFNLTGEEVRDMFDIGREAALSLLTRRSIVNRRKVNRRQPEQL